MKRNRPLILIVAAAAAVAAWAVPGVLQDEGARTASTAEPSVAPPPSGYVVQIDPATGRIVSSPQQVDPAILDGEMLDRLSTSAEGLVERPSPVPGGGTMVELEGRFQHAFVATAGDSARVAASCISRPAAAANDGGGEGR